MGKKVIFVLMLFVFLFGLSLLLFPLWNGAFLVCDVYLSLLKSFPYASKLSDTLLNFCQPL